MPTRGRSRASMRSATHLHPVGALRAPAPHSPENILSATAGGPEYFSLEHLRFFVNQLRSIDSQSRKLFLFKSNKLGLPIEFHSGYFFYEISGESCYAFEAGD